MYIYICMICMYVCLGLHAQRNYGRKVCFFNFFYHYFFFYTKCEWNTEAKSSQI